MQLLWITQSELLKYAVSVVPHLTNVCNMVWHQEQIPADWKNRISIPLPKKGDLTECSNWRGITLLSVFARVLLNCMQDAIDQLLRQKQAGVQAWKIVHRPDLHLPSGMISQTYKQQVQTLKNLTTSATLVATYRATVAVKRTSDFVSEKQQQYLE